MNLHTAEFLSADEAHSVCQDRVADSKSLGLASFRRIKQATLTASMLAVPLQTWSGPEGTKKLRFPGFMTRAQGSGRVVSLTHRPLLPPGYAPGIHFC